MPDSPGKFFHLGKQDSPVNVVHVVLPTKCRHVPMRIALSLSVLGGLRHPMEPQSTQGQGQARVVKTHRTTFSASQIFRGEKGEAGGMRELRWLYPITLSFHAMRCVFHDL